MLHAAKGQGFCKVSTSDDNKYSTIADFYTDHDSTNIWHTGSSQHSGCAHHDDDAPNYENGPFRYEDEELEITHAGGGVGDIAAHTCQYITCPGSAIRVHVLNSSQHLLTSTQSYSQESQSSFAGEVCLPRFVHMQLDESDGSAH